MSTEIPDQLHGTVGGHAAAAMSGMHPFITPAQIYAELRAKLLGRRIERAAPSDDMLMGLAMEPTLEHLYQQATGRDVQANALLVDPLNRWRVGHPDAVWFDERSGDIAGGVDYKSASDYHPGARWSEGNVPEYVNVQCNWYMDLCGPQVTSWDVWATIRGAYPKLYTVPVNPDLIDLLRHQAKSFLKDHVLAGVQPTIDDSERTQEAIRALHPAPLIQEPRPCNDPDLIAAAEQYMVARDGIKSIESAKTGAGSKLMAAIGDEYGLLLPNAKVTWASVAGRKALDMNGFLADLLTLVPPEKLDDLQRKHTKAGAPGRRLSVTENKPGKEQAQP